jgi:hypothetical protein
MSTLEDRLLNGPSALDDDNDDLRSAGDSSGGSDDEISPSDAHHAGAGAGRAALSPLEAAALDPFGERTGGPSGGPKAVIADKEWADFLAAKAADRDSMRAWAIARRSAVGSDMTGPGGSVSASAERAAKTVVRAGRERAGSAGSDDDDDGAGSGHAGDASGKANNAYADADEDEEDDEFTAAYRKARLAQLRALAAAPRFGGVTEITDRDKLPATVDSTPADVVVLCLIWEDFAPGCAAWRRAWTSLSSSHPTTRFLSMQAGVASDHWDPVALPAIAVYKAGQTIGSAVRLHGSEEEGGSGLGRSPSVGDVEGWLVAQGWLGGAFKGAGTGSESGAGKNG